MEKTANMFPNYTSTLEEIADQLEDIYDRLKEGGDVYKMGEECDEKLSQWYTGEMANNVHSSGRKLLGVITDLQDYAYTIEEASNNEENKDYEE